MAKIVRRPDRAEGGITAAEKKKMDAIAQEWIQIAMRTAPIEPGKIVPAIKEIYRAAKLKEPRVVIVPSPLVMALAGGFAAAIWHIRKTGFMADAATRAATYDATDAATRAATYAATDAATRDATHAATYDATDAATHDATYDATRDALVKFFIACAQNWSKMYQGGNMWAGWESYIVAARDVLQLSLPSHGAYTGWEQAARNGGFRMMHEEFCIVSDFPEIFKKDENNAPHCDDGPSHRWRDGWSLYFIHGVRVTEQIVMRPQTLKVADVTNEKNTEVRRIMLERFPTSRFVAESGAKAVDVDSHRHNGTRVLFRASIGGESTQWLHCACPSTARTYWMDVPNEVKTCEEADKYLSALPEGVRLVGAT